jgi:hypothetical protein
MVNFPTSLDSLANPGPGTYEDDVGFVHSDQHANANDILEALEGKLGIGASTPVVNQALIGTGTGASGWGLITASSSVVAGSIDTARLAANAVSQTGAAIGSSGAITTTSTTDVNMTDMAVTLTTVGGDLLCWFEGTFTHSASGVVILGISLDGASAGGMGRKAVVANSGGVSIGTLARFTGVAAGSHTVRVVWSVVSGTATANNNERYLLIEEKKK